MTAGAKSFHAAVHHRLQARVHPFLTIQKRKPEQQLLSTLKWVEALLRPAELRTDVNAWRTSWAAQTQTCQRSLSSSCGGSSQRCVAACIDADLHRSLEPAPQHQMYEMMGGSWGEGGGRAPFQILWCGRREEHSTWMQRVPCLFWQGAAVMALRHDGEN